MYRFRFSLKAHHRSNTFAACALDTGKLSTTLTLYVPVT